NVVQDRGSRFALLREHRKLDRRPIVCAAIQGTFADSEQPMKIGRQVTAASILLILAIPAHADSKRDAVWSAARSGDVKALQKAIDDGGDVNAKNEYGVTALWIAAGKPKFEVVELLVKKGADVNARDDIWYQTPLSSAVGAQQVKSIKFLIESGAKDVDAALITAASMGSSAITKLI